MSTRGTLAALAGATILACAGLSACADSGTDSEDASYTGAAVAESTTEEATSSTESSSTEPSPAESATSSEEAATQAPASSAQQQTSTQQQAPPQAPEPSQDPGDVPNADGGTCPAYQCGYGHDENGNPNPSSGEIQQWWANCTATNTAEYCRANDPYQ